MHNDIRRYLNMREEEVVCGINCREFTSCMFPHEEDCIIVNLDDEFAVVNAWSIHPEYGGHVIYTATIEACKMENCAHYKQAVWNEMSKAFGMLLNYGW